MQCSLIVARCVDPIKAIEQSLQMGIGNWRAWVGDGDLDRIFLSRNSHDDPGASA